MNSASHNAFPGRVMLLYYAATAVFVLLDLVLDVNVRVAFLESLPWARAGYYGVCFACLGVILWRPPSAVLVGAFESLVTLSALIIHFGMRVLLATDRVVETGTGFVTMQEIVNFLVAGVIAYIAWINGISRLSRQKST
jgi:hypothetical protein